MVYTVTFNPALDYVVRVEKLTVGGANRAGCGDHGAGVCGRVHRLRAGT